MGFMQPIKALQMVPPQRKGRKVLLTKDAREKKEPSHHPSQSLLTLPFFILSKALLRNNFILQFIEIAMSNDIKNMIYKLFYFMK